MPENTTISGSLSPPAVNLNVQIPVNDGGVSLTVTIRGLASEASATIINSATVVEGVLSVYLSNGSTIAVTGNMTDPTGLPGTLSSTSAMTAPATLPDLAWNIQDSAGNVAFGIDTAGAAHATSANFGSLSVAALSASGSFTASSLTATTAILGGDTIQAPPMPMIDLVSSVMDSAGNIVGGYASDGSFNVTSLNSLGPISIGGRKIGSSGVPSDCIDVTATAYGAIGDAVENICTATVSGSPADTLTISNFSGVMSLVQTTTNTATLTIVGTKYSGVAFQPYNVGQQLYLVCGSYVLQANVLQYIEGQTVILSAAGVTPLAAVAGKITCPCFQGFNANEYLVFEGMGQNKVYADQFATPQADSATPYGTQTFIAQIATVAAPDRITIATTFPFAWDGPAHLRWGANDAAAVTAAAQAAFAQQKRKIYFPGDGRLYLLLGFGYGDAGRVSYIDGGDINSAAALNGVLWFGDNVKSFVCDQTGLISPRRVTPVGSDDQRLCDRSFHGRGSFKRCSHLSSINLFVIGDSQSVVNPQLQASGWMQVHKFVEEFTRANVGKTVKVYHMGVGGATFAWLAAPTFIIGAPLGQWNVPSPTPGTRPYSAFLQNANQTGSGAAVLPDCVAIFQNGGNDKNNFDGASMRYIINLIRSISHGDGFGPPDIIMQTDNLAVTATTTVGTTSGVSLAPSSTRDFYREYSAGILRTTAAVAGFPCVDLGLLVLRACFGYDPMHRGMRSVLAQTVSAAPGAPMVLPYRCYDYSFFLSLPGPGDAAVWRAMTELDFQVSVNPGNKAMMRRGANGNLWVGVSSWGGTVATNCTIAAGDTSLTVGTPEAFAGLTFTMKDGLPQFGTTTPIFTPGMVGQCMIAPTGFTGQPQRNFIAGLIDEYDVVMQDEAFFSQFVGVKGASVTIGGAQFMVQDSISQPDVVIYYPDGTIWNTQVASGGYVSGTQAALASAAPQALSGQTVQVFIGRMGVKWFDTGFSLGALAGTGTWTLDVNRGSLIIMYIFPTTTQPTPIIDILMERFGGPFYPVVTPGSEQQIVINNAWIDTDKPFQPVATPWEIRGITSHNQDYYLGGVGGHPSSMLRAYVTDNFYQNQNLCTY